MHFQLVAVAAGSLALPEVTLAAPRYGAELAPLAGRRVFATPAPVAPPSPMPDAGRARGGLRAAQHLTRRCCTVLVQCAHASAYR